jgi:hypothetical protein
MEWQDKKDVLLKALFDAQDRRKTPGPSGISSIEVEKAMGEAGASPREVQRLRKVLEKEGYVRRGSRDFNLSPKGKCYVQEKWDHRIKEVWEKNKKDKLENLGKED